MKTTILRLPQVEAAVGLKRERIRQLEVAGQFPTRFQITPNGRAVGWLESEVNQWIAERIASVRQGDAA